MKRYTIFLSLIMAVSWLHGQQLLPLHQEYIHQSIVSPNLEENANGAISYQLDQFLAATVHIPIETRYDAFTIGGGYFNSDNYLGGSFYIGRSSGRFKMSVMVDVYHANNRTASSGGFSLSFHHNTGAIGVTIRDLFDVAIVDGTEEDFFLYEAITPQFFLKQDLIVFDSWKIQGLGISSYHPIQAWNGRGIISLVTDYGAFSGGYSTATGYVAIAEVSFKYVNVIASYDGNWMFGFKVSNI